MPQIGDKPNKAPSPLDRIPLQDAVTGALFHTRINQLPAGTASTPTPTLVSDGLIARYNFSELTGTTLTDSSGNTRNGTLVNTPTWLDTDYDRGLGFAGTAHISIPTTGLSWIAGDFTLEICYYPQNYTSWSRLFECGIASENHNVYFAASSGTTGRPVYGVRAGASGNTNPGDIVSPIALDLRRWHFLTFRLSGNSFRMHRNRGLLVAAITTLNPANISRPTAYIARSFYGGDAYLDGQIAYWAMYNRALTKAEMRSNYLAAKTILETAGIML